MKWPPLQRFFYAACKEQLTDLNGRRLPGLPRLSIVHLIGAAIRQPTIQTHPNRLTGSKTEWGRRPCTASGRAWCTLSPLVVAHRSTPRGGSVRGGGHAQPTILSRTAPFPWERRRLWEDLSGDMDQGIEIRPRPTMDQRASGNVHVTMSCNDWHCLMRAVYQWGGQLWEHDPKTQKTKQMYITNK